MSENEKIKNKILISIIKEGRTKYKKILMKKIEQNPTLYNYFKNEIETYKKKIKDGFYTFYFHMLNKTR